MRFADMTFADYKKFLDAYSDFYLFKAIAASEVSCAADADELELTDDEFDEVCEFVYNWILDTDAPANEVASKVCDGLHRGEISMASFSEMAEDGRQTKAEAWLNGRI